MKEKEITTEMKVSQFIGRHWRSLFGALLAVVIVGVAYISYIYYSKKQEMWAQEDLFVVQNAYETKAKELKQELAKDKKPAKKSGKIDKKNKPKSNDDDEEDGDDSAEAKANGENIDLVKTPEELNKNFSSNISQYENFISNHSGRKAAYIAAIQLAEMAADYKNLPLAEKTLRSVVSQPSPQDVFFGLIRAQLSRILMDEKKYPEAISELTAISDNKGQSYFLPLTLLRLATCYIEAGDWDKAQSALVRVETEFPQTQPADEAKQLKKILALKKGQKT